MRGKAYWKTEHLGVGCLSSPKLRDPWKDLEALLDRPLNPDEMDENGWVSLGAAAVSGHREAVCLLLEAGADTERRMSDGATPLVIAAQNGYVEIVHLLLHAGAGVNKTVPQLGAAALHAASQNLHPLENSCLGFRV